MPPAALTTRIVRSSITSRSRKAPPAMAPWTTRTVIADERDAPAEGGGEGDAGDAVEQRLHGQQPDLAGQAVLDRPEDRERADAEDERGGDEGLGDAARLALAREPPLEPAAERLQPVLEAQQLTDGAAEQHRRQHRQLVAGQRGRIGQDAAGPCSRRAASRTGRAHRSGCSGSVAASGCRGARRSPCRSSTVTTLRIVPVRNIGPSRLERERFDHVLGAERGLGTAEQHVGDPVDDRRAMAVVRLVQLRQRGDRAVGGDALDRGEGPVRAPRRR